MWWSIKKLGERTVWGYTGYVGLYGLCEMLQVGA